MLCQVLQLLALSIGEHRALRGDSAGEGAVERGKVACGHRRAERGLIFRMQGSLCGCRLQGERSIPATCNHKPARSLQVTNQVAHEPHNRLLGFDHFDKSKSWISRSKSDREWIFFLSQGPLPEKGTGCARDCNPRLSPNLPEF